MITLARLRADHFKGLRAIDLQFPLSGSVLIEGHNESGKSTLFEAIFAALYGRALVGEGGENHAKLDDLVAFDAPAATVELTILAGETTIEIARQFPRGKSHQARVTVTRPGTPPETRHGITAVNERVLAELGGLDGEALRNSCFVEQQELGRLESLNRGQREQAIERLLGLERLARLAEQVRQDGRATEEELGRARDRLALATALTEAEQARAVEAAAQEDHAAAEARAILADLAALGDDHATLAGQRDNQAESGMALRARISRADDLTVFLADLTRLDIQARNLISERGRVNDEEADRQARLSEWRDLTLPQAQEHLAQLYQATEARAAADEAERAAQDATRQAQEAAEAANAVARAAALAQRAAQDAERATAAERAAQEAERIALRRDALDAWCRVAGIATELHAVADRVTELDQRRVLAVERHDRASRRLSSANHRSLLLSVALVIAMLFAIIVRQPSLELVAVPLIAGALLVRREPVKALRAATADLTAAEHDLSDARATADGARRVSGDSALVERAHADLARLGLGAIATPEDAQRALATLPPAPERAAAAEAARVALGSAEAARERARHTRAALDSLLPADEPLTAARDAALTSAEAATLIREAADRAALSARAALIAAAMPADATLVTLTAALSRLEQEISDGESQAAALAATAPADDTVARLRDDVDHRRAAMLPVAATLGFATPAPTDTLDALPQWSASLMTRIQTELAALDRESARRDLDALLNADGGHAARLSRGVSDAAQLRERLRPLLAARDAWPANDTPRLATAAERWPRLTAPDLPPLAGAEERERIATQERIQAESRARLLTPPDMPPAALTALTPSAAARDVARLTAQRDVTERGLTVVSQARRAIVRRVLPATERNMRAMLPLLTAGRYHDVRLTAEHEDQDSVERADYRIFVYERAAGRPVGKSIFSGGTRDQCSLALRLAFALATLPQGRGVTPGFLFLDEPLSSFDDERAAALVELLTRGLIARNFAQVFVISHQHAFAASDFTYHLRMEHGRVAASDLPALAPVAAPARFEQ